MGAHPTHCFTADSAKPSFKRVEQVPTFTQWLVREDTSLERPPNTEGPTTRDRAASSLLANGDTEVISKCVDGN